MATKIDITGQKFGRLTALRDTQTSNADGRVWEFQCNCGNIVERSGSRVKNGRIKSCGCLAKEIIVERNISHNTIQLGNRYGKLTVIQHLGYRQENSRNKRCAWYLCECDCGNRKEVMGNRLQSKFTLSCGCLSSYGESEIERILKNYEIKYSTQKTFEGLRSQETNTLLRFDFCIYNEDETIKCLIEYDGRSHRTGPEGNWTQSVSLETIQLRDKMKNDFCLQRNIPLYRIPSNEIIDFTLNEILNEKFLVKEEE